MKIYFYDNKIREFCFSDQKHQALLERVATRTCVSADNWEPLSGTNGLYSVRTNGKDRLLFIYIEDTLNNNKTAILVWRHIPHNYSPIIKTFKKSKNLNHFKLSEETALKDEKGKASEETKEKPEFSETYGEFKETSELNNYFVLDNKQQEAVYRPLPVLLEGGPGSGKTTVLQTILEQQLQNKKILCLSKSKFLIDEITEEWTLSPLYAANKERVDIRTYESFFEEVLRNADLPLNYQSETFKAWLPIRLQNKSKKLAYKNLKLEKICTENADNEDLKLQLAFEELREEFQAQVFSAWFQERFANKRTKGRRPTFSIEDSNLVYEEFRIASGYKDQASYVKSGDKQSSLNVNQRDALYTYYTQWISHLKTNQLYISDFFDLTPYLGNIQDQYSKLLIDEGQDFSHLQLNLLVKLLPAGQFVVCVDQRQNLFDSNPKSIYLKNIINEHCRTDNPIEPLVLPNAYRCPGEVMRFAVGVFNELRRQFTPVTKQEAPIEIPPDNEGRVVLLDPKHLSSEEDKREFALLQEKTKSIDTCIITDETNFDDTERLFPDFIKRFTPKQAKGLGAKCVILLNILNHSFFHEINKLLENGNLKNLPKAAKYCTLLSECFVAATRAELEVYMVQENMDSHNLANIKKRIEFVMNTNKAPEHKQEPATITTSTPEELKQEALNLYKKGLQEEAFDILTKRVKMSKEEAFALLNELTMENLAQQKEKALQAIKSGNLREIRRIFSSANSVLLFGPKDSMELLEALVSSTRNRLEMFKTVLNSQNITLNASTSSIVFPIIDGCHRVAQPGEPDTGQPNAKQIEQLNLLRVLVAHKKFEINIEGIQNDSPLIHAIFGNHLSAVEVLLKSKNIDPNLRVMYADTRDCTALIFAVTYGADLRILEALLNDQRTDVTITDSTNSHTVLHMLTTDEDYPNAARSILFKTQSPEVINRLINSVNNDGYTPFSMAIKNKNFHLVKYLLDHYEVDLNKVNDMLSDKAKKILEAIINNLSPKQAQAEKSVDTKELFAAVDAEDIDRLNRVVSNATITLDALESYNLIERIIFSNTNEAEMLKIVLFNEKIIMAEFPSKVVFRLIELLKDEKIPAVRNKKNVLLGLLIEHEDFDINVKNSKNETALDLALNYKLTLSIKMLLTSDHIMPYADNLEGLLRIMEDENIPLDTILNILNHKNTDLTQTFGYRADDHNLFHRISIKNSPRLIDILEKLFEKNPNKKIPINQANQMGFVPLSLAITTLINSSKPKGNSDFAMIKYLLNYSEIDLRLATDIYKLLDYIYEKSSIDIAIDIIELLTHPVHNHPINWNYQSTTKKTTALMLTCKQKSDLSVTCYVRLTETKHAGLMQFDTSGCSALFYAILYKNTEIFKCFIHYTLMLQNQDLFHVHALTNDPNKIAILKNSFVFLLSELESDKETKPEVLEMSRKIALDLFPTVPKPLTFSPKASATVPLVPKRIEEEAPKATPKTNALPAVIPPAKRALKVAPKTNTFLN